MYVDSIINFNDMIEQHSGTKFVQFHGDAFKVTEGPIPKPKAGEVLVKNAFSSVHPVDAFYMNYKNDG
jgi:NADPH-dependent curcumin reductase CurA